MIENDTHALALTLTRTHWLAVECAATEGVGYICSDFEQGELTVEQCSHLWAYRNETATGIESSYRCALSFYPRLPGDHETRDGLTDYEFLNVDHEWTTWGAEIAHAVRTGTP